MIIEIIAFLSILIASSLIMNQSVYAKETLRANIINGLTYADTCLYMLESPRQLEIDSALALDPTEGQKDSKLRSNRIITAIDCSTSAMLYGQQRLKAQ